MRHGKHMRAGTRRARVAADEPMVVGAHWKKDATSALAPPPPAGRPAGLENLRAGLLRCLAHEPTVCRSVGLVR